MKLVQRLQSLVKVAVEDVIGEEPAPEGHTHPDSATSRLTALIDEAQSRLDTLRLELAEATERQKRITREWQAAAQKAQALEQAVDAAIAAGQEDRAATLLRQAQQAHAHAQELADLRQASEQFREQLRSAVESRQEQLSQLRQRYATLADRERTAEALESLLQVQRQQAGQDEATNQEFRAREEQIARHEDRLAARQEWSQ
jgi:phage shock protein A